MHRKRLSILNLEPIIEDDKKNNTNSQRPVGQVRPSAFLNFVDILPQINSVSRKSKFLPQIQSELPSLKKYQSMEQFSLPAISPNTSAKKEMVIRSMPTLNDDIFITKNNRIGILGLKQNKKKITVRFRNSIQVLDIGNGIITKSQIEDGVKPLRRVAHRPSKSTIA